MLSILKILAGKGAVLVLGIALFVLGFFLLKSSCTYSNASRYIERRGEKNFLIYGAVVIFAGVVCVSYSFSKKKDWKDEAIKPTGRKVNSNPEVNLEIENYTIEPMMEGSKFKCIRTTVVRHGEKKSLQVNLVDDAGYEKISPGEKLHLCGELLDDVWTMTLNNARVIDTSTSTV